ncbi:MAG TPA: UDP-N-acetylglucosamine 2-epimerase [Planctomycetota bacterium]|nr:UDP-N-acetylglucosamine 2-epimerase [Planctomycetota bacterium]
MRVAVVAGARPQFVKAAALLPALRARGEAILVHTGQHDDPRMVEAHFAGLALAPPDHRLDVASRERPARLAEMVDGLTRLLERHPVDRVLALGDADSAVAAAVAASFREIPVAHVEAGARSGERELPEERNRILVDEASDLFFCSTDAHARNLDGLDGVHVTGDVMADVLLARLGALPRRHGDYAVLTLHRAGTADDPAAVARVLAAAAGAGCPVVFPRHPRTRVGALPGNVAEAPPLPYLEFLGLVAGARFALTDSGGLQKEAYLLGVPCITLRDATEWGETVDVGWNVLVGTDPERIAKALRSPPRGPGRPALYGDGHAAERIAALLAG